MKKVISFLLLLGSLLSAKPQTGLDPGFATGGVGVYSPMPHSQAQAIAVQADGKILVAGLGSSNPLVGPVIRLNTDGTMDAGFNGNGTLLISGMQTIESLAVQPDGKIVMAGIGYISTIDYNVFMVVRLNTDGSFDNSFGTNGIVHVDIVYGVDYGQALALQPDGKIVIAGNSQVPGGDFDISIVRLNSNGSLDNSFDGDGKMILERIGTTEYESGLIIQPDGKIIIEGKTYLGPDSDLLVARINAGGGLDNSFGLNGIFIYEEIAGYEPYFGKTLALQPDGKILVGRNTYLGGGAMKFIALRINPNGTLDNSFDSDGVVTVVFGGMEDICTSIALQQDGKIILSGNSFGIAPNRNDVALARLNPDGSPDLCFNQTGKLIIPRLDWDEAVDMVLQSDGKILVTGYTENPSTSFFVMRIQSTGGTGLDADGDGYNSCVDCNDNNPAINPGATEICNGIDDDCDGQIDEVGATFYRDADGDGFGNPNNTTQACSAPAGYVSDNTDCDDTKLLYADNDNDGYGAGSPAPCGVENNTDCNDADAGVHTAITYYQDADNDGFGNPAISASFCQATPPQGYAANNFDCDDTKLLYADSDNDGYGAGPPAACGIDNNLDCNDNNPGVRPNATESCNGIDDNCNGQTDEGIPTFTYYFDGDGDGWGIASQTIQACTFPAGYAVNPGDCDDNNPAIHPGATEICNGIDEDCDGQIDDGALQAWYFDNDGDGYGNSNQFLLQCTQPQNYVALGGDCNDNNASIHPNAAEVCNGIDDNCDGVIDDGLTLNTYYQDNDGDGYGIMVTRLACSPPPGYASQAGDCNDNDPAVNPGATEVCNSVDDDCDGQIDEGLLITWYRDGDGDGYGDPNAVLTVCFQPAGYITNSGDCNDNDPAINPGATEICNEKDDDCDGQIDEGFVKNTYYRDADGDGYGDANNSLQACTQPFGYVTNSSDCDDGNDTIHPNATEYCNGIDENCNGIIDDNPVLITWYRDADQDGWGDPTVTVQACTPPPGYIREALDCDDTDPAINPEAAEVANGKDDDCDGQIDEGTTSTTWYRDADADGFGDPANSTQAATQPAGYVSDNTDCNDNDASIHPGASETCNGIDDDCDGQVDEGITIPAWYADADGDGYGNPAISQQSCTQPQGYVSSNTDCDDNNAEINPGAAEICDNIDNNCNGQIDEAAKTIFYRDADNDGFGDPNTTTEACTVPAGYVSNNTDCNDNNAAIYPGATEICNGVDDDCDGLVDEGVKITFYRDADGDGFGDPNTTTEACTVPAGYVSNNTDCNDNNAAIYPGAPEICNNTDDDCDGQVDEGITTSSWYEDNDGDGYGDPNSSKQACTQPQGYVNNNNDCDDNNAEVNPAAAELCDGIDNNCNGQVDEGVKLIFYRDADNDGFGDPNTTTEACTVPAGYVPDNTDCDDSRLLYADNDNDGFGAGAPVACGVITNTDCNDNDPAINPNTNWYLDSDNDNYYTGNAVTQCNSPGAGYKISGLIGGADCNDDNVNIHPGATEVCGNNADDNCNLQTDEDCTPAISINDVTVYESQGQAVLTISLSDVSSNPVKVNYRTLDGTATRPKDYKQVNGSVTIPAGSLSAQVTITINPDNVAEETEYFDVQISVPRVMGQAQNVIITDDIGRVAILDGIAPGLTKVNTAKNRKGNEGEQQPEIFELSAYPNPSSGHFLLNIESSSSEPANIRIYDATGRLLQQMQTTSPRIWIGAGLSQGIYIVEGQQGKFRNSIKLVKL